MKFEDVREVWMKLVDADVDVLPSSDGTVYVEAAPESAFSLKEHSGKLSILTSTWWKLRNLPRKDKERVRLVVRVPEGVEISGGMKRVSLHAEGTSFGSLAVGEATAELRDCTVRKLAAGFTRLSGSLYVWEKTKIALSMGSLELKVLELEAPIDVSVVMGSLRLSLPEDCDAFVDAVENIDGVILNPRQLFGSGEHRIRLSNMRGTIVVGTWGDENDV
ncbi:DUF4097 family beta strand repeat-containing protein [Thermococcus henrietii]|uniref:hypothetical protein n=1 Tax=Thermococcus henrietii TaxID=2016361 RepID=UPI000C087F78|nr:hypothetical protein [Thermococcus henrietii]